MEKRSIARLLCPLHRYAPELAHCFTMLVRVATSIMYSFVLEPYTNHKAGGKSITLWPVHCSCSKIPCCAFKIPISDCAMWDLHGVEQLMHQARRLYLKRRSRSCFWMNSWQDALALHQALHVFCPPRMARPVAHAWLAVPCSARLSRMNTSKLPP